MKILFITSSLNPNDGWGRYSEGLAKALRGNNDIRIISSELSEKSNLKVGVILNRPEKYLSNPLRSFMAARKMGQVINSFNPDAIHFLVEPYITILPFLKLNPKTKVFLTAHGTYSFLPSVFTGEKIKAFFTKSLVLRSFKRLNGIIAVSSYTKEHILREYRKTYGEEYQKGSAIWWKNRLRYRWETSGKLVC